MEKDYDEEIKTVKILEQKLGNMGFDHIDE